MVYEKNLKPTTENKKPFEIAYKLKDYEVKKSPLSPVARNKVINKSGSNFLSENAEGYGPMPMDYSWQKDLPGGGVIIGCGQTAQVEYIFRLKVECHNWNGYGGIKEVGSLSDAWTLRDDIVNGNWPNTWISWGVRNKCAELVSRAMSDYSPRRGLDGRVMVRGHFWGDFESSYNYRTLN